ncbi:MAG: hypothetical protein AAFU41_13840 [Pseudomonadota bacterium]
MSRFKTFKTVVSTVTIAVAVGFIVQYGEQSGATADATEDNTIGKAPRTLMMATNAAGESVFGVPDVVTAPLDHAANQRALLAVDAVYTELDVPPVGTLMATPVPGCAVALDLRRQIAAMVELTVTAPCDESASFIVHHEDMRVAGVTDNEGKAVMTLPALATQADFVLSINNIKQTSADIFVPELRQYDRAILQWRNRTNMRLHAFEDGAQIGDAGHVWSASIHSAEDTRAGRHGFVMALGDTDAEIPYQAEVYTFPEGQMNRDGGVDLQIGVRVTEDNCGREVDAKTIQTNAGQMLVKEEISAQMPGCELVGEVAFLQNIFTDLTPPSN